MNPIAIYPYKEDPEIRKMRVQAWFRAVSLASKLTPRELERQFSESESDRRVKRSCVWDKYRRGEVVPRSGLRPDGGLNLVDRVEAVYPGTAKWLMLPLWRLLDRAPMEMSEIRRCYENLPVAMRMMFVCQDTEASILFWRRSTIEYNKVLDILIRFDNLEGVTAMLVMLREAECCQNRRQYQLYMDKILSYIIRLEKVSCVRELFVDIEYYFRFFIKIECI